MIRLLAPLALLLSACAPHERSPAYQERSAGYETGTPEPVEKDRVAPASPERVGLPKDRTTPVAPTPPERPEPATPPRPPRYLKTTLAGISLEAVTFDDRSHRLVVADQPDGPGSRWPHARDAGSSHGGLAAINGGFFTPEGRPLGRLIASGHATGAINRASSLGDGFYVENDGHPALLRRERFSGGREALQSGPFLIENGGRIAGLGPRVSSARSFIATDGRHGWILARTGACSLADLADALRGRSLGGVEIRTALNLDGGRSSEIWASSSIPGGPAFNRPLWNNPVRNFLVLKTRQGSD